MHLNGNTLVWRVKGERLRSCSLARFIVCYNSHPCCGDLMTKRELTFLPKKMADGEEIRLGVYIADGNCFNHVISRA